MSAEIKVEYRAEPTLQKFHLSDAFYRFIVGPVGSGKSTACCMEIMRRAMEQAPSPFDGKRHTRWAVIRNTKQQLKDTTIRTWLDWFREDQFGELSRSDLTHRIQFNDVDMEVLFRPLDTPDDVRRVLSLEVTGVWLNECREIPKIIVDALGDRTGRFPSQREGGWTWRGVFGDTNPPDDSSWLYKMAEEVRPEGWDFFKQPGGLVELNGEFVSNPEAENLRNLEENYYLTRKEGKKPDYVRVYYCAQYGFVQEGRPVHQDYVDSIHCHKDILEPVKGIPIVLGFDFGLTPAVSFLQRLPNGRWIIFDEIVTEDMGIAKCCELMLLPKLQGEYQGFDYSAWGDPAGDKRADTDEFTPYQMLAAYGIKAKPCHTNDPSLRRGSMEAPLRRIVDGKPGLIISPRCKILRKALAGGFHYKRVRVSGEERYHEEPAKNIYSHICESSEYALLSSGEGRELINRNRGRNRERDEEYIGSRFRRPSYATPMQHRWMM